METLTKYPGSCGEILQGKFNNLDVLLSCPVNIFTTVRLFETNIPLERYNHSKGSAFLNNILGRCGYESINKNLDIVIESDIPKGKGFAGSTADLCAIYLCALKFFKRECNIKELIEETVKVEPTDSIIFKDMTIFDYKKGLYYKTIGEYIKFYILAFEGKRAVDTIAFNNKNLPPLKDIDDVVLMVSQAIKTGDIKKLSKASSISIERNLERIDYPILDLIKCHCINSGGLGIIGAHSGDILGIIYNDKERLFYGAKNIQIPGYKTHVLETLQRNEYEGEYNYNFK